MANCFVDKVVLESHFQYFSCFLNDGVHVIVLIVFALILFLVRVVAELDMLFLGIEVRAGRKAYPPSVGQFRREWQARPAAGFVTNQGDIGKSAHGVDKIIGCTIGMTVGQDNYLFLPADTVGRFHINGSRI